MLSTQLTNPWKLLYKTVIHYGKHILCRVPKTLGKGLKTLGKAFAECGTRQRTLGNAYIRQRVLCRVLFIGHSAKALPSAVKHSAKKNTRQRKISENNEIIFKNREKNNFNSGEALLA